MELLDVPVQECYGPLLLGVEQYAGEETLLLAGRECAAGVRDRAGLDPAKDFLVAAAPVEEGTQGSVGGKDGVLFGPAAAERRQGNSKSIRLGWASETRHVGSGSLSSAAALRAARSVQTPEARAAPKTLLASGVVLKSPPMRTGTLPSAEATVNRSRSKASFSAF